MPSSRQPVSPLANIPSGTRTLNARAIPDDLTAIGFELSRCTTATPTHWPNASTTIAVECEVNYGSGWEFGGRWTAEGGIAVDGDGGEWPRSFCIFTLKPGTGRQIRGSLTVTNGPLRTEITILEVTPE